MHNLVLEIIQVLKDTTAAQPRAGSFWEGFDKLDDLSVDEFSTLSAGALRRLGRTTPDFNENLASQIKNEYPSLLEKNAGFYGRFILAASVKKSECVKEMITRGSDDEQAAAIIALNFREDGEIYKDNVVHACRTNSTTVHSAVSQDNPYPAQFFDDQEFKQLTIKTIFMGLDFDKIKNIEDRFTGDLGKSLTDFFEERRAAGRWLPDNVLEFMKRKGLIS